MKLERIEAALRRRPSDERPYDEPLGALPASSGDRGQEGERLRPELRARVGGVGLPALATVAAILAIAVGALISLPRFVATGPGPKSSVPTGSPRALVPPVGLVSCFGQGVGFSPDRLAGVGKDEAAATGPAAALRALLASGTADQLPKHGWHLAVDTASAATFVAPVGGEYVEVSVEAGGSGTIQADGWAVGGYGSCVLMSVPPAGDGPARWTLDPAHPFAAGATELHLLVTEQSCHSFTSAEGRIEPTVVQTDDSVTVTLFVRLLGGAQECPGTPPTPYVLHLDRPVGDRDLFDGGSYPPVTVIHGGRPVVSPTPTPRPSDAHLPGDCSGGTDAAGFFKAAASSMRFDVYCAVLPDGWIVASSHMDDAAQTLEFVYQGPNGSLLTIREGAICGSTTDCGRTAAAEAAAFGNRTGELRLDDPGMYSLFVDPDRSISWAALGKGLDRATFVSLAAGLILVTP